MTRVLMVAHDGGYQASLRQQLMNQGFAVDVASSSDEARERTRDEAYEVILMDLTATGPEGFELCRDIGDPDNGPMVMMIAPPDGAAERLAGFEAGADACVSKPVIGREIAARMRALTRRLPLSSDLETAG